MGITDELRKYAQDWRETPNLMDDLDAGDIDGLLGDLEHIADRIDAEHEAACAEAYGNGVMSVPISLDESAWVELPKDADGEVIHIGDKMEGVDKYDSLKNVTGEVTAISFKSDGIVDVAIQAWNRVGNSWHIVHLDPNASVYRHYHKPPTVEDMLREFAEKVIDSQIPSVHPTYEEAITEYAAKLRLVDDEEEQ